MSKITIVGAFGQANPGDEALCEAFCTALAGHDLTVASSDPAATEARHSCRAITSSAAAVASSVRSSDAVVVGGGTVFKRLHRSANRRAHGLLGNTAALVAGAHARHTRVAMIGVGAANLRGAPARRLCRWTVPRADLLILRDEESAAVLAGAGVRPPFWIGADPSWTLFEPPSGDQRAPRDGRAITVALSHLAGGPAFVARLASALEPMAAESHIRLQPWQREETHLDHRMARDLHRLLPGSSIIDPPADLHDAVRTFANDDLVIGLRFHALVAAAVAGTRFVAIAHEPKLAGLARRMHQTSLPGHATSVVMRRTFEWALAGEPPPSAAIAAEVAAAGHAFRMLRLLVEGGEVEHPDEIPTLPLSSGTGTW
jgi:polysaccharide pyruvyl transferase WcaK-like protein